MIQAKDYNQDDLKQRILNEVAQEAIMSFYLGIEIKLGKLFKNPLRNDKNPSAGFYYSAKGSLYFHDFGRATHYDFVRVVMEKFKIVYREALKQIESDLGSIKMVHAEVVPIKQSELEVILTDMTSYYLDYWKQYQISATTLNRFSVGAVKSILVDGKIKSRSTERNPIFIYKLNENIKLYRPKESREKKWSGNATIKDVGGIRCLPKKGVLCFVTSSIKDAMVL